MIILKFGLKMSKNRLVFIKKNPFEYPRSMLSHQNSSVAEFKEKNCKKIATYGSIGLVSIKMKKKLVDFHVLGLFIAKNMICHAPLPLNT
jgi:hypothetical protein